MSETLRQRHPVVTGVGDQSIASRMTPEGTRSLAHIIDVGLVLSTVAAVMTQAVVIWFHMIFVLLVVTALVLPLRGLIIRLVVWAVVATSLVGWAVAEHDTPSTELAELPILTFVIILVFLVARSREESHIALRSSQRLVRERVEAERDSLRTQLEQSQRLDVLGRASTRVAHDLRNVLTIVQWCAADLLEDPNERYRRHGRSASEAAQRGIDLLDEMLAMGREQSGERDTIDLVEVVDKATPLLRHLLPEGVGLEVGMPTASTEIRMSRTELMQILMNLLSNAVDAVDADGMIWLDVDVVTRVTPTGNSRRVVTVSVIDNGRGVDAEFLPIVFDPGFTTKTEHHSGLGLSTVWTIVARAGGRTEFTTTSRGSRVDIELPPASEFIERRALIEVTDPGTRLLLEDEFSSLGFIVAAEAQTTVDAENEALLVIVHDHEHDYDTDLGVAPDRRCRVIDLQHHLDHGTTPITRERAAIVVRRIVDEVTQGQPAA